MNCKKAVRVGKLVSVVNAEHTLLLDVACKVSSGGRLGCRLLLVVACAELEEVDFDCDGSGGGQGCLVILKCVTRGNRNLSNRKRSRVEAHMADDSSPI
jgi:hypothetical protein